MPVSAPLFGTLLWTAFNVPAEQIRSWHAVRGYYYLLPIGNYGNELNRIRQIPNIGMIPVDRDQNYIYI